MEIFGGFMVMMSIISLFLAVVWLIMPFVVFAIKGKQDRTLEILEAIEKRLAIIETHIHQGSSLHCSEAGSAGSRDTSAGSSDELPIDDAENIVDIVTEKNGIETPPAGF
ncbi:MAG: hypothetical protein PHH28_08715 [Desulfuromonadaceae bacterium]|nr:hypothetical protein [Desulfuromonadaceae bacterium]